ncbi:hypothetical protein [Saccharospirillum salsuginis]|uniref:Cytochrome P460 n=1 Tax=Saccharospirillum salsuginis TaxID=418750 RepID=A0A918JZ07_9GAMM|nr:hypothetical protein [Saccharospirillum salsuginis]GGX38076.1 hypothetical protein GCM10007392_00220 [Saccharospirillum salsuginis]
MTKDLLSRLLPRLIRAMLAITLTMPLAGFSGAEPDAADLPLPSSLPQHDYETQLYTWLMRQQYKTLGWQHDAMVRDTGPYIEGEYYGTHPAVRIFYSPEVMDWLKNDRQGDIADGAMIIKEMYSPPAVLYQDLEQKPEYQRDPAAYEAMLGQLVSAWTVMVKDSQGSHDGWYWSGTSAPDKDQSVEAAVRSQVERYGQFPNSGFGAPCLRCHGSAENELTFSTFRNLNGPKSTDYPLRFMVDSSWRSEAHFNNYPLSLLADDPFVRNRMMIPTGQRPWSDTSVPGLKDYVSAHLGRGGESEQVPSREALASPNAAFLEQFPSLASKAPSLLSDVTAFPSQWTDHVVPGPGDPETFMTSSNCMGCHGGLGGLPYGVTMFVQTGPNYGDGYNVSEYGEWRWSPMGLAGRDPIFHAQLESEMAYIERDAGLTPNPLRGSVEDTQQAITNTCLSCHGAMGQRQLAIDAELDPSLDPNFNVDYFYLTERMSSKDPKPDDYAYHKYGELAREGISCAVCHRIDAPSAAAISQWQPAEPDWLTPETPRELAYSLFHNSTGRFERGPNDAFFGPFDDVSTEPMNTVIGAEPKHNDFVQDSQLCGTCHTINLPNIGLSEPPSPVLDAVETNPAFADYAHTIEQATFLEWQNSAFAQGEGDPSSSFQSCQDCHMPGGFKTLDGRVNIDQLVTQIAAVQDANFPGAEETLPLEDLDIPFRDDYTRHEHVGLNVFLLEMFDQFPEILGVVKNDYMTSADNGVDLAIENMVRLAREDTAAIDIQSVSIKDGRLTTQVRLQNKTGHRFPSGVAFRRAFVELLIKEDGRVIWGSGRTNAAGVIVDGNGQPLTTEFLPGPEDYQPHHERITREDQVQIYEELNRNAQNQFTTSFVHRVDSPKDNRLLPRGWRESSVFKPQGQVMEQFMEATDPHGVGNDPDYQDQGPAFPGEDNLSYEIALPAGVDTSKLVVEATLYYQAIPPYWLHQRFTTAPDGLATQRLYYMTSRLNLEDTPMENWKLKLVNDTFEVRPDS